MVKTNAAVKTENKKASSHPEEIQLQEETVVVSVPVEKLDEEFDLAIIGKKGKWYDHKVSVTDVQEQTEEEKNAVEIGEEEKSEDADTTTDAAAEEENKD